MSNSVKIVMSSNPEILNSEINKYEFSATVEAEYGEVVVEGSEVTLAHHGVRSENPAPCLRDNDKIDVQVIGLSHIDLDSLGGIMSILGTKHDDKEFWGLAAFVDVNGPHKVSEFKPSEKAWVKLNAFWSYSEKNRVFPNRDGSIIDVTNKVTEFAQRITAILMSDEFDQEGHDFIAANKSRDTTTFVCQIGQVIIRSGEVFCNDLYRNGKVVIAFSDKFKSITVSKADSSIDLNCKDLVQGLWGSLAGGHVGIAGSPRGQVMTSVDLYRSVCVSLGDKRLPRKLKKQIKLSV